MYHGARGHFTPASRRLDNIHVDLVGHVPQSQNYNYFLLTVVDIFTRKPFCRKMHRQRHARRPSHFGVQAELTSDRGTQFTSELWSVLSYSDNCVPSYVAWDRGKFPSDLRLYYNPSHFPKSTLNLN